MTAQTRQPKGVPVGGQFAERERADAETTLAAPKLPWSLARNNAIAKSGELNDGMHEQRLPWLLREKPAESARRMREAAAAAEASLAAEQIKTTGYDPDWAETWRKMADGHTAIAQQLERASDYEFGDDLGSGVTKTEGAWTVSLGGGQALAYRNDSNETLHTTLLRFPNGWRVGKVWTMSAPPKTVIALANRMAKKLP